MLKTVTALAAPPQQLLGRHLTKATVGARYPVEMLIALKGK